jgi:hypothetical protein
VVGKRLYRASSKRGGDDVVGEYPLRLAFQAREGNGDVVGR